MQVTYTVVRVADGWTVFEDGRPIEQRSYKPDAVEVGHLLTVASKAAGGAATLVVQDGAGELETWDLDHVDQQLSTIFAGDRARRSRIRRLQRPADLSPAAPSAPA